MRHLPPSTILPTILLLTLSAGCHSTPEHDSPDAAALEHGSPLREDKDLDGFASIETGGTDCHDELRTVHADCGICTQCVLDGTAVEHWYAIADLRVPLLDPARLEGAGFNLDDLVTPTPTEGVSGEPFHDLTSPAPERIAGIDNYLILLNAAFGGLSPGGLNAGFLNAGELLLLRLSGVAGCSDDDVTVEFYHRTLLPGEVLQVDVTGRLLPGNVLVPSTAPITLIGTFAKARLYLGRLYAEDGTVLLPNDTAMGFPPLRSAQLDVCVTATGLDLGLLGGVGTVVDWAEYSTRPVRDTITPEQALPIFANGADMLPVSDGSGGLSYSAVSSGLVVSGVAGTRTPLAP